MRRKALSAHRDTVVVPILLTCLSYACYNVNDAALKMLAAKFHYTQIICINSAFVILFLSAWGAWQEGKQAFRTKMWKPVGLRALFSQGVSVCNIFALPHLQLTTFYTIVFTSPFIVALLSMVFLKEKPGPRRLAVILAGFAVVLFVFRPGGGLMNVWLGAALLGAFLYSGQLVLIRHMMRGSTGESRVFMFLAGSAMGILWTAPLLPAHYIAPSLFDWSLFLTCGLIGGSGLLCMSRAFEKAASAAVIVPFHYTQIIWAALLGWLIFGDIPDPRIMAGAAAIIGLGLYLILSESRAARIPDAETAVEA